MQVVAACLALILTRLSLSEDCRQRKVANVLTHISIGFIFVALFCDVIKMNFGLDPAVPVTEMNTEKP